MATLQELWNDMPNATRTAVGSGVGIIAIVTFAACYWLLRDRPGVLFTGMEPHDAAAVVAELDNLKISYDLADGGTKILVPDSQVHEVRLKLQGTGMPLAGGSGFELFDDSEFGMTEFAQRINFQRAMQGELSRTITSMPEVKRTRVHLVLPDTSLFGRKQELASAAVTLSIVGNKSLRKVQIQGIQRLVAASVEGLEERMVTVVDQNGVTLSRAVTKEGTAEAVSARIEKKQEVEDYLRGKADDVLVSILGPDKAVVTIDASLGMDRVKTTLQKVVTRDDGNGWVKMRRETRNWTGLEEEGGDGGVTTEIQYDLGHSVEEVVAMPGAIERLSIGVLLPGPINDDDVGKIEDVVSMAVGFSAKRGDSIAVRVVERENQSLEQLALANSIIAGGGSGSAPAEIIDMNTIGSTTDLAPKTLESPFFSRKTLALGGNGIHTIVIGLAVIVLLLVALLVFVIRSRPGTPQALSQNEREQMLQRLQKWLDDESPRADEAPL